jgi:ProP effector
MTAKPFTLCGSDKAKAALAARMTGRPLAAEVFKTRAEPPAPPAPAKPAAPPQPELNAAQIAGRARRKADWERRHRGKIVLERLIVQFPECFKPPDQTPRPLKIGIHLDVAAALPDVSRNDQDLAFGIYVRTKAYHATLVEGAPRIDLNGDPAGAVSAVEARPRKPKTESTET